MISETELWSFDPEEGRSIRVTLKQSERHGLASLDMRWDDGAPVKFPVKLTFVDLQNLVEIVLDYARKHGIEIKLPQEDLHPR